MFQNSASSDATHHIQDASAQDERRRHITIVGAGVAGAWQALSFAKAGYSVKVIERDDAAMTHATSHFAGGMLAPWCEQETSEPVITRLGTRSLDLWRTELPDTPFNGSLVVAHPRDRADFDHFARITSDYERLDGTAIDKLEPSLEGRFREALFFPHEGHVEPRRVLPQLHEKITKAGGEIRFNSECEPDKLAKDSGIVIDCRGIFARDAVKDVRGVKGEMIIVQTDEVSLSRPVRVMHPRWPLYVIPREDNHFMIGASLRPALPDNLPRIAIDGNRIAVNGLYRHGFLLAPALAELTVNYVARGQVDNEVMQCS